MRLRDQENNTADSQQEKIRHALEYVWDELKSCYDYYHRMDSRLKFSGRKEDFFKKFYEIYDGIMDAYMNDSVEELDRHKVVATQITACIECNLITREVGKNQVFLGLYMFPLEVGLNWMLLGLNDDLKKAEIPEQIEQYSMPKAFACATGYFDIFARNLYYSHKKGKGLNPLDISEKLFLLEYITLLENGIDPKVLAYKAPNVES